MRIQQRILFLEQHAQDGRHGDNAHNVFCLFNSSKSAWLLSIDHRIVRESPSRTLTVYVHACRGLLTFLGRAWLARFEIVFVAGSRLNVDDLEGRIDISEFSESQLVPPTDPRPTSDTVNNQLLKIVRILGMIGQKIGLTADAIEAELTEHAP